RLGAWALPVQSVRSPPRRLPHRGTGVAVLPRGAPPRSPRPERRVQEASSMNARARAAVFLTVAACALGCSSALEGHHRVAPAEVPAASAHLMPSAIVRYKERISIPPHAEIAPDKVSFSREGRYAHKLGAGDVILANPDGSIRAVRTAA